MGKTNLLDAIYYLSSGKSYFNNIDSQNINHREKYFTLQGSFSTIEGSEEVFCGFTAGRKKVLKRNDVEYDKLAEHYGKFPAVMVTPLDLNLVTEGSEERRRFMDSTLSIYDKDYLQKLVQYNHVLAQRNSLLKQHREGEKLNKSLLQVYDGQLQAFSQLLYPKRRQFIEELSPLFNQFAGQINEHQEELKLRYDSQLSKENLLDLLAKNLEKDKVLGRTEVGLHKDRLEFKIGSSPLKKFGSQGQQKSYVLALKLAQAKMVEQKTGKKPILLLDDIFDRLDDLRAARLLELCHEVFHQIFITDTSRERLLAALQKAGKDGEFFEVKGGVVEAEAAHE